MAKTTNEAVLIDSFPPTALSLPRDSSRDITVMMAVPAMQANTIKLLTAHTDFEPIHRHIGSMRKELIPRTTCLNRNGY